MLSQGDAMRDYGISVLEQYDMHVNSTRRIRGAVLCDTDQGLFLLKESSRQAARINALAEIYTMLQEQGFEMTDHPVRNKEGEYVTTAEDGTTYLLKKWYAGRECDIRKESEMKEAAKILAKIHLILRGKEGVIRWECEGLEKEYERHNRELRKVRAFVRGRSVKGEFERLFLQSFEQMYEQAETALLRLQASQIGSLEEEAKKEGQMIHGEYNYHNILICQDQVAVTGFERARRGVQLEDLYYFLRKSLEKHKFDERMGYQIIRAYDGVIPLKRTEREYLAVRLSYPDKFWKLSNSYYHSNKAWIPEKNVEKLKACVSASEEKKRFLKNIFAFHF